MWYALAALALLLLGGSFYAYYITFYSPHPGQNDPNNLMEGEQYAPFRETILRQTGEMGKRPCEEVRIRSYDGLTLFGRYYHTADGAPLMICFHGYRSVSLRDFSGSTARQLRTGNNVLLIDQRAHGRSGGHTITFGIRERYDCLAWANYAAERFGKEQKILLSGISMGAATVLMASSLALPENVRGIVADCPYSSPAAIIRKVCRDRGLPDGVFYPLIWLGALLFGRLRPGAASATEAVGKTRVPILLIHGEDDRFVPCDMGREIAAASPLAELHTFPEAGHGLSYLLDPVRYEALLSRFRERTLGE